ncbi:MAG: radical SAM protein [Bacteroidales bacterium]|jgi:hypothetical protein
MFDVVILKAIPYIDEDLIHTINLNLYGISNGGSIIKELYDGIFQYPELNIVLPTCEYNGKSAVSRKIPIVQSGQTPYSLKNGSIYYNDTLIFNESAIKIVPLINGKPRNFKGYSLSFEGTKDPFVELRINPKNTGNCPGRCLFCHRVYSYRLKPQTHTKNYSSKQIINSIIKDYGENIFTKISHVSVITELYGNEGRFLEFLSELKKELIKCGGNSFMSFGTCSQDIRTDRGLQELYKLVNPKKYSFTLETFSRRAEIMSNYKGIPMDRVKEVLKNARKAKFEEIKINYVSGIDSFSDFENNLTELKDLDLIDSIGISVFTVFFSDQIKLRHPEAYDINYYLKMIRLIKELGIKFYKPDCYEMGIPLKLLEY